MVASVVLGIGEIDSHMSLQRANAEGPPMDTRRQNSDQTWLSDHAADKVAELRRIAARHVADATARDDVVQQAMSNAWNFLHRGGRVVSNRTGWLRTLLFNAIRRHYRSSRHWRPLSADAASRLPAADVVWPDSDEAAECEVQRSRLRAALNASNDLGLRVLQLRCREFDYRKIAGIVGKSPLACRVAASRALTKLKIALTA
jgi:RNA polymerase sigma factor (sigma-70 family)